MSLLVYPERGVAVIERLPSGERWEVNTNGSPPAFSPDGQRMVWQVGSGGPTNSRRSDLYLANVDGSEARFVATFIGGGAQAWFPDSARLLVVARPSLEVQERALMVLDLADGATRQLAQAERIGTVRLSPGGTWVAYLITFAPNPADNGIWLARTDGGGLKRLEQFGAYQWRDDDRLLLIPLEPGRGSHALWEVKAATGQARPLTDPAETPFKIANGDWSVSPQGDRIVFVNALDRALWLLQFP
jgi:Tol biopolymer transport system component